MELEGSPTLLSLPPGCIYNIMTQLPPLARMQLGNTCKSYQLVLRHGRFHSHVQGATGPAVPAHLQNTDGCFGTLSAAVRHSRPGGTIVVGPGHHEAVDIVILHPLRIVGSTGGDSSVLICSSPGATASLQFCASGEVADLSIRSTRAACLSGQGGSRLWVRHCSLECDASGLAHLYSAIITARPVFRVSRTPASLQAAAAMGQGGIHVSETVVQGGIKAAGLQAVRCIAHGNRHSLWFDIQHCVPSELRHLLPAASSAQADVSSEPTGSKRKRVESCEVDAEALLDKRALSWSNQYARTPL